MAAKKAKAKKKTAAPQAKKLPAIKDRYTKSAIVAELSDKADLSKKQVGVVLDELPVGQSGLGGGFRDRVDVGVVADVVGQGQSGAHEVQDAGGAKHEGDACRFLYRLLEREARGGAVHDPLDHLE